MFDGIDFYSDTMTRPSEAMKKAMFNARLGDEQKGEDPTTIMLEEEMARRTGKTAAMFFPSATMCNQIAVNLHCRPGEEIIGADLCHIFNSECGGAAFHSGAQARAITTTDGIFSAQQLQDHIRDQETVHSPISSLVVIENTSNFGGGVVWPLSTLSSVIATAKKNSLKTHLDGARIFNAAVATNKDLASLSMGFDTVTICFSKGLGCATGAVLAFDKEHWARIRRFKQVYGGALRQSGILSAACLYALEHHVSELARDHELAQLLARKLSEIDAISVFNLQPETNMVYFCVDEKHMDPNLFLSHCLEQGLRFSRMGKNRFRAVTHRDVTEEHVTTACARLGTIFMR